MANEQNLIPFTSNQSREEAKKNGTKGGKKSGEVRRQRKAMKEQMEMLLSMPLKVTNRNGDKLADMIETLGIDKDNIDNQMAIVVALWQTAMNSKSNQQIQAVQEIRKIVQDEQTVNDDDRVQIINDLPPNEEELDDDQS